MAKNPFDAPGVILTEAVTVVGEEDPVRYCRMPRQGDDGRPGDCTPAARVTAAEIATAIAAGDGSMIWRSDGQERVHVPVKARSCGRLSAR